MLLKPAFAMAQDTNMASQPLATAPCFGVKSTVSAQITEIFRANF
jgi:hypothetical protein